MTIEEIKEECREQITWDANMEPACFRGGFTPKAAQVVLDAIDALERICPAVLTEESSRDERTAYHAIETLCRTWEGSK